MRKPNKRHKLKIVSDGNNQNKGSILKNFDENVVEYGQVHKIRENQIVVEIDKRQIFGEMPKNKITMNKIDSYCGTLRERVPIYVRETKAFSKKRINVQNRLDIYQVYRNFIWKNGKKTPAMLEGITDRVWNWKDVFMRRVYPSY